MLPFYCYANTPIFTGAGINPGAPSRRTLSKNGVLFLIDGFDGNEPLARSVNHLLVVGFYLINLGFALVRMESRRGIETMDAAILFLTQNIGLVMLIVGVMHMFNLFLIGRYRAGAD